MATKALTTEQVQKLHLFTENWQQPTECCAEAAIRRIQELEARVEHLEAELIEARGFIDEDDRKQKAMDE